MLYSKRSYFSVLGFAFFIYAFIFDTKKTRKYIIFDGIIGAGKTTLIKLLEENMKNIKDNQAVGGYPASGITDWHRNTLILKKLRKKK